MNRLKQFLCGFITGHRNTILNEDTHQKRCAGCGGELNHTWTASVGASDYVALWRANEENI